MPNNLWGIGRTAEDKDWSDIDEEVKQEIRQHMDEYRPRFEQEFDGEKFPRHPYKIMMKIRKEEDLYGGNSHHKPKLLRALKILKEEYEKEWSSMANA